MYRRSFYKYLKDSFLHGGDGGDTPTPPPTPPEPEPQYIYLKTETDCNDLFGFNEDNDEYFQLTTTVGDGYIYRSTWSEVEGIINTVILNHWYKPWQENEGDLTPHPPYVQSEMTLREISDKGLWDSKTWYFLDGETYRVINERYGPIDMCYYYLSDGETEYVYNRYTIMESNMSDDVEEPYGIVEIDSLPTRVRLTKDQGNYYYTMDGTTHSYTGMRYTIATHLPTDEDGDGLYGKVDNIYYPLTHTSETINTYDYKYYPYGQYNTVSKDYKPYYRWIQEEYKEYPQNLEYISNHDLWEDNKWKYRSSSTVYSTISRTLTGSVTNHYYALPDGTAYTGQRYELV